jgi:hypothetical protein
MVKKATDLFRGRDGDFWEVMSQESAYGSEDYYGTTWTASNDCGIWNLD